MRLPIHIGFIFYFLFSIDCLAKSVPLPINHVCASNVNSILDIQIQKTQWQRGYGNELNTKVWKFRSFKRGLTYIITVENAYLLRLDQHFATKPPRSLHFSTKTNCKPLEIPSNTSVRKIANDINELKTSDKVFNDKKLHELVNKNLNGGIIYTWSTNMPLSFQSIPNMKTAAKKMNLPVIFLLDPNSSFEEAKKAAALIHLEESEIVYNISEEIFNLGGTLHYPTSILYLNGEISPRKYPGNKTSEVYENWIKYEQQLLKQENP